MILLPLLSCALIGDAEFDARLDYDGDGHIAAQFEGDDCADDDANVHPDAAELCDGVDNDCDGTTDAGAADAPTWYADPDGDGYGGAEQASCTQPEGYIATPGDCDSGNASINPDAAEVWYDGVDQDCAGDDDNDQDKDGVQVDTDCDDTDASIFPGAEEIWYDGIDQDCSGGSDDDQDGDGFDVGDECDDTDASVFPGAEDAWYDGIDSNCDGLSDFDADLDGHDGVEGGGEDCDDGDALAYPGAAEWCDGIDQDCDGEVADDESLDAPVWLADGDGDGFGDAAVARAACSVPAGYVADATDCDDGDVGVFPGANEYCDEIDADCDGEARDADALDAVTWNADADGDLYGDASATALGCDAPSGYVADGNDCDDADAAVNPGENEVCDAYNLDEDCDGVSDDDDGSVTGLNTYYLDADGDRYGDGTSTVSVCERPSGYVTNTTDCDDTDDEVNPGADEVCDSLDVDEDCDGVADDDDSSVTGQTTYYVDSDGDGYGAGSDFSSCESGSTRATNDSDCDDSDATVSPDSGDCSVEATDIGVADAVWTGEASGDAAGFSVAGVGDVNVDGYDDVVVGAYGNSSGGVQSGTAYLILGSSSPASMALSGADAEFTGGSSGDYAGYAVSRAGDFNGDGLADFIVGSVNSDAGATTGGAAHVVVGAASLGSASLTTAFATWTGEDASDRAGTSVACAGDTNGDGLDDVLVGAGSVSDFGSQSGAAYLVLGGGAGGLQSLSIADAQYTGESANDAAGRAVSGAGDFNGDGLADFLVGAFGADGSGGSDSGQAYLILGTAGPVSGPLSSADANFSGVAAADYAGYAVSGGGDLDQDGFDDVLVGAPYADVAATQAGAVYLVRGSTTVASVELDSADARWEGVQEYGNAGSSVAGAGDVDATGSADVVVGAYGYDVDVGAAYVVLGDEQPSSISLASSDAMFLGEMAGDLAGGSAAGAGDVDADGFDDIVIGAENQYSGGSHAGAAYLILGSSL